MEGPALAHRTTVVAEKHEDNLGKENFSYVFYTVIIVNVDSGGSGFNHSLPHHLGITYPVKASTRLSVGRREADLTYLFTLALILIPDAQPISH